MFFNFGSRLSSSTVQVHETGESEHNLSGNKIWDLIKGHYSDINFPIMFKQEYGKNWTDILDTGWPSRFLISSKLKDILESHNFTGWKAFPIKLFDKKSNEVFGYHGFSITGKCASIDYKKSVIIEKQYAPNAPVCQIYKGVFLDQWDGSDFFCPDGSYRIFVTERVVSELKKNKITNFKFIETEQLETDVKIIKR